MSVLFGVMRVLAVLVVTFVAIAALVTAMRGAKRPASVTGLWVLFGGCAIGVLVVLSETAVDMLAGQLLGSGGSALYLTVAVVLSVVNIVSTALMVAGIALVRPEATSSPARAGGSP